ncbi:MAG: phosphoribosylformylglycinamidine synthase, partial [Clostridia bacterium]|nr:phosphoribosylformylglycinamidine synthase [Clostridia bacterium]
MVFRVYVEKRGELAHEAMNLFENVRGFLGISALESVRILNRYDVEGIGEDLFESAVKTVFSEPQVDDASTDYDAEGGIVFAVEYLPGQFDQRADSAAQCIQILSRGERPTVRTAKIYILHGALSEDEIAKIKKYVINPVEAREASLDLPATLALSVNVPESVATVEGFLNLDRDGLADMIKTLGLAMDIDDITFCREYFKTEGRNPTITEIRMIDTYWSD